MEKINIKTLHGHLFTCGKCNKYHFEFNQFGIDFSSLNALNDFKDYLSELDSEEFERINQNSQYNRKIQIPFPNTSIKMLLSSMELKELIVLLATFIHEYNIAVTENEAIRQLSKLSANQMN
jgi:hypothetical protein